MGVQLTQEELDEFLTHSLTVHVATIRKSGMPLLTALWYVWMDGSVFFGSAEESPKIQHIKRDPRAAFIVEEGDQWIDLKAVTAGCDAIIVTDEATLKRYHALREAKYAGKALPRESLPTVSQKHYARERVIIKLTPRPGELKSWYNRKIRRPGAPASASA